VPPYFLYGLKNLPCSVNLKKEKCFFYFDKMSFDTQKRFIKQKQK